VRWENVQFGGLTLHATTPLEEPIHGGVEIVLGGVLEVEFLTECGVMPVASGRQLGAGKEESLGDHGQHEVTLPRGPGGDEGVEAEATDHRQDGFDMAMRPRAEDAKGVGGGDEGLPLERAADQVNDRDREVGEVSEGLVLDLAVLSKGASEIVTGVGYPLDGVGDFGNVYCSWFAFHVPNISEEIAGCQGWPVKILATNCKQNRGEVLYWKGFASKTGPELRASKEPAGAGPGAGY
jgi:hypothetical protein